MSFFFFCVIQTDIELLAKIPKCLKRAQENLQLSVLTHFFFCIGHQIGLELITETSKPAANFTITLSNLPSIRNNNNFCGSLKKQGARIHQFRTVYS